MSNNDIIRNSLIGLSSAIPNIGGSVSLLLDKAIPSEVENRTNSFLLSLDKEIRELGRDIRNERWEDEKFKSLFRKVLNQIISEHVQARCIMLQNITIHLLTDEWCHNEEEFYIYLVERLSNYSIQYLYGCYTNTPIDDYKLFCDYPVLQEYLMNGMAECHRYMLAHGNELTPFGKRFCDFIFSPSQLLQSPT